MRSIILFMALFGLFSSAFADLRGIGDNLDKEGNRLSQSHENINVQPVEALAGTVISTGGNTIKYIGRALSLIQQEGYEEIVEATIDSGACIAKKAENGQILELTACGVEVAGRFLSISIDFVSRETGNLIYYVTEVASDLSGIWLEAFDACARTLGEENWPRYVRPCTAIAVVFDYAGRLVRAVGIAIVDTVAAVAYDSGSLVINTFNIPASLIRLEPEDAMQSTFYALHSLFCGVVDIVLVIPRFLSEILGDKPVRRCLEFSQSGSDPYDQIRAEGGWKAFSEIEGL
ncbi:MAG: hypothetical protein KDD61_03675 [Bdellovibrionales bacterium]|nr:hypothetical protein [Bdellovibrionales bacterium]